MGRWQQEYERNWRSYTADVLRASGAAPPFTSYRVSAADLDVLQDVLRSLGSATDALSLRPTAPTRKTTTMTLSHHHTPLPERHDQRQRRRRQSSVRFTTPLVTADDSVSFAACLPMTQVLQDDDPMHSDAASGSEEEEEAEDGEGNGSDASMQSDESYVYRTPQPKSKTRRRSSTSMRSFRSSTSTFPAFTPQDLRHSLDQAHRESASQSLRHRLADVSPIGPARLRFSVDGALLNTSSTVLEDSAVLCDTVAMPPSSSPGDEVQWQQEEKDLQRRRLSLGFTPRPVPPARARDDEPLAAEPTTPDVGELDVSMQSMHLSEDHSFRDDGEMEIEMDVDGDRDERSSPGIVLSEAMQSNEKEPRDDIDDIRTQLNFNDASDDEEQEEEEDQVIAESAAATATATAAQSPPATRANLNLNLNLNVNPDRWHWSAGASEDPPIEKQEPPEVIVIDDDDMVGNTEESGDANKPRETDDQRLERAGLRLSDDERTREMPAKRNSTAATRRAAATSSRQRHCNETRTVFRTKLPLPVETYYTSVDERRRRRRRKLEDKIAAATASTARTVPELRVELPPYQRRAVDWMLARERFPKRTLEDGTCSTESGSDSGPSNSSSSSSSSSRQRAAYYARLTDKVRGGILADEMGLGKTICCIAMICESLRAERERLDSGNDSGHSHHSSSSAEDAESHEQQQQQSRRLPRLTAPTLIVTPLSILSQWEREIRDKTNLSVMTYQGPTRKQIQSVVNFMGVDVVLSTYDTLRLKECKVSKTKSKSRRRRATEPEAEDWAGDGNDEDDEDDDDDPAAELLNQQLDDSTEWRTSARRLSASKKAAAACRLHQLTWHRVILDESHLITNAACARAKAAFALQSRRRWCVTGTPFQNSGRDLSALLGFLGVDALSPHDDALSRGDLQRILSRLMLRRFKSTVDAVTRAPIVQLPSKIEETIELEFQSDVEKAYYTLLHHSTKRQVLQYLGRAGSTRLRRHRAPSSTSTQPQSQHFMHVFELLLRLRQCCNASELVTPDALAEIRAHQPSQRARVGSLPRAEAELLQRALASEQQQQPPPPSTKIQALLKELAAAKSAGERVLVISQWTSFLDLVGDAIDAANCARPSSLGVVFGRLDGRMTSREREQVVATFQHERRLDVLLVSLRTGGLGLNLTAASQVFIMEPSWNPSIETQAVDRAHRVGQAASRVRVVRFLMRGTIEERVVALQQKKRRLAAHALGDGVDNNNATDGDAEPSTEKASALSRDDLRGLFTQCDDGAGDEEDEEEEEEEEEQREKATGAGDDSSHSHLRVEEAIWDDME